MFAFLSRTGKALTRLRRRIRVLAVILPALAALVSGAAYGAGPVFSDELAAEVHLGLHVVDVTSGKTVASLNARHTFSPASTLKTVTTIEALRAFGKTHRFETRLLRDEPCAHRCNWYLEMGGDPSLTLENLTELFRAASLYAPVIHGDVVVIDHVFSSPPYGPGWMWDSTQICYSAPVTGFMVNRNCFAATFTPPATVSLAAPAFASFTVDAAPGTCSLELEPQGENRYRLHGCFPDASPIPLQVAYHDIPRLAQASIAEALRQAGIRLKGAVRFGGALPRDQRVLATHASEPLENLVRDMLKRSDNLYAESLVKHVARKRTGQPGTWPDGTAALQEAMAQALPAPRPGVVIRDGSGLSRYNLLRPDGFAAYLRSAYAADPQVFDLFPEWDVPGVYAKTGTMTGISALAGFIRTRSGHVLAFAFMADHMTEKPADVKNALKLLLTTLQQQ